MLLTWCYGLTHNFSLPRATGCLHSSDREKTVSRNARKRYVSERACFYIPKGEKPRNFMGLKAKSYSTINTVANMTGSGGSCMEPFRWRRAFFLGLVSYAASLAGLVFDPIV